MTVKRWRIIDPYVTIPNTLGPGDTELPREYHFPRNPASMTSPYPDKGVTSRATTTGRILLFEGGTGAKQWQFSGPLLDKQQLDDLNHWVYERQNRLVIEDHYGRYVGVYLMGLDVLPKRRINYYYSHDYTVTALVLTLKYGSNEVPNAGPGA